MSTINIADFDGTITINSDTVYKDLFGISHEEYPKTAIAKCMDYIKDNGDVEKYISKVKKSLKYRKELVECLKNRNSAYIISDNPFVKELIPSELKPVGIYPTIVPEIIGGNFTGRILEESTKVEIMQKQLPKPNGNKINFYTDGGPSDEKLIKYLLDNYENVIVLRY
ncbi:MAG: hypothetical protein DRP06_03045 [Candidatus Aenigmatarchaeota archaeon]|nr:MAG: hypothetical protein DRP06_03045 [Candidatus Aenigmarchaeota archaeon]